MGFRSTLINVGMLDKCDDNKSIKLIFWDSEKNLSDYYYMYVEYNKKLK